MTVHSALIALAFVGMGLIASAQEAVIDGAPIAGNPAAAPGPLNPDLDGSGTLDAFDYLRFKSLFEAGDPDADLDGSGTLDVFDFLAFHNAFAAGLPATAEDAPGWMARTSPDRWCVTEEGEDGVAVVCAPRGPCDDPANRNASIPTANTPFKTIRLSIHVFCENNGSNCAATQADVAAAVAQLNTDFAPWRFRFIYEFNFVNKTAYRYLDRNTEEAAMKNAYANSPATKLNIYVVDTGNVCWGIAPWLPQALGTGGGVVMHYTWFVATTPLPHTLTHEVGHCLGLYHTFYGTDEVTQCGDCYEAAGRSSEEGDITGDRCSDTNPSPMNVNYCFDPPGTDPCSGLPWLDTPYANYMSYGHACTDRFSTQQAGRMHCWTTNMLLGWLAAPNAPGAPALSKPGGGQVLVQWADNSDDETGFRVQRETKSGPKWINTQVIATVGAGTISVTDAPGVGTFRYRVQAFGQAGDSTWSAWTQITN